MIFDEAGNLVWFDPLPAGTEATNLQVQQLQGRPVLSWWQGYIPPQGFGQGEEVILDSLLPPDRPRARRQRLQRRPARLPHHPDNDRAADGLRPDRAATSPAYGGPRRGAVTDTIFQEVDLAHGARAPRVARPRPRPAGDSYSSARAPAASWPFDYFHINSVQQTPRRDDADLGAQHLGALRTRRTAPARCVTRIGGRHSDVKLSPGAATAYQHDADAAAQRDDQHLRQRRRAQGPPAVARRRRAR